jgi:ApaG protein
VPASAPIELPGLRVTVDRVLYHPQAGMGGDRPHCFESDSPVVIKGRKWVVRDEDGEITALEGDGVVGQTPLLNPGETFSYNSFHLLRTRSAVAEGAYIGLDGDGRSVFTRIPPFRMVAPDED